MRDYILLGAFLALLIRSEIVTLALLLIGAACLVFWIFTECAERSL